MPVDSQFEYGTFSNGVKLTVLTDGQPVSAEALLRWTHPLLGPISPGEFIPVL